MAECCEKIRSAADEYLRGELEKNEEKHIEEHMAECAECSLYIEEERIYQKEIKLAEYIPEKSISKSVMEKIIENVIIVDKPPKKRFFPIGLISAAAVAVVMFAVFRGGVPKNLDLQSNKAEYAEIMPENAEFIAADAGIEVPDAAAKEAGQIAGAAEAEQIIEEAAGGYGQTGIFEVYYIKTDGADIFAGVEIYEIVGNTSIIEKKYKETLDKNLSENNISFEIQSEDINGEYIYILYLLD